MLKQTGEESYLSDAYNTVIKFYKEFHDFYAIGIPCRVLIESLTTAGRKEDREIVLALFRKQADMYVRNGVLVPEHEVNYEQTIIAPSVAFLCEFFLYYQGAKIFRCSKSTIACIRII